MDKKHMRQAIIDNALDVIADCNSIISEMDEILREVSNRGEADRDDPGFGNIRLDAEGD